MNVRFCPACRALILSDFRYCPYCGAEAPRGPGIEEALGGPFSRIEAGRPGSEATGTRPPGPSSAVPEGSAAPVYDCFAPAEESLRRLEAEMESILASGLGRRGCTGS